jgi:hypothetical protein
MNLRHITSETTDTKREEIPWYKQPETTETTIEVSVSASPVLPSPKTALQALFEPSEAERILARAGALQEIHGNLLSPEQIEAIAAEIGIKPEFVHLAIEQEKNGVAAESLAATKAPFRNLTRLRVVTTMIACVLVAATHAAMYFIDTEQSDLDGTIQIWGACVFPLALAFSLGIVGRSRRWGAVSGVAIAVAAIATINVLCHLDGASIPLDKPMVGLYSLMVSSGAMFSILGAQVRRVMAERLAMKQKSAESSDARQCPTID